MPKAIIQNTGVLCLHEENALLQADGTFDGSDPRRRISIACIRCRNRKIRCDGQTSCSKCVASGVPCEYQRITKEENDYAREKKARAKAHRMVRLVEVGKESIHEAASKLARRRLAKRVPQPTICEKVEGEAGSQPCTPSFNGVHSMPLSSPSLPEGHDLVYSPDYTMMGAEGQQQPYQYQLVYDYPASPHGPEELAQHASGYFAEFNTCESATSINTLCTTIDGYAISSHYDSSCPPTPSSATPAMDAMYSSPMTDLDSNSPGFSPIAAAHYTSYEEEQHASHTMPGLSRSQSTPQLHQAVPFPAETSGLAGPGSQPAGLCMFLPGTTAAEHNPQPDAQHQATPPPQPQAQAQSAPAPAHAHSPAPHHSCQCQCSGSAHPPSHAYGPPPPGHFYPHVYHPHWQPGQPWMHGQHQQGHHAYPYHAPAPYGAHQQPTVYYPYGYSQHAAPARQPAAAVPSRPKFNHTRTISLPVNHATLPPYSGPVDWSKRPLAPLAGAGSVDTTATTTTTAIEAMTAPAVAPAPPTPRPSPDRSYSGYGTASSFSTVQTVRMDQVCHPAQ